jgi:chondroitin 4-sulfotransferase 11
MSKILFVHIPKTGGTSIKTTQFFKSKCEWFLHDFAIKHQKENQDSFCFVRNPYDRLVSAYFFIKNGGIRSKDDLERAKRVNKYPDFKTFCKHLDEFKNEMHFIPQYKYVVNNDDNVIVKNILRFENINSDFSEFISKYNLKNNNLPIVNTSKHDHFNNYYDEETKNIVYNFYIKDFKLFNYK